MDKQKAALSELELEERTIGLQRKFVYDTPKDEGVHGIPPIITSDISDLELEERTIGLPRKLVLETKKEEATQGIEPEINSDIRDLELQERTIGLPIKNISDPHKEGGSKLGGRIKPEAAKEKKIAIANTKKSGCCMAFLVLGASAVVSIWGITKII